MKKRASSWKRTGDMALTVHEAQQTSGRLATASKSVPARSDAHHAPIDFGVRPLKGGKNGNNLWNSQYCFHFRC